MKKNKTGISVRKVAEISAGVAVIGASAYYLLGPKRKQHRKKVGTLATKIKREIEKELKKMKSVTQPFYQDAVDTIVKTYSKKYKDYSDEINTFAKKLKTHPPLKKAKKLFKKVI